MSAVPISITCMSRWPMAVASAASGHGSGKVGGQRGSRKGLVDDLSDMLVRRLSLGCGLVSPGKLIGTFQALLSLLAKISRRGGVETNSCTDILSWVSWCRASINLRYVCIVGGPHPFLIGQDDHQ